MVLVCLCLNVFSLGIQEFFSRALERLSKGIYHFLIGCRRPPDGDKDTQSVETVLTPLRSDPCAPNPRAVTEYIFRPYRPRGMVATAQARGFLAHLCRTPKSEACKTRCAPLTAHLRMQSIVARCRQYTRIEQKRC